MYYLLLKFIDIYRIIYSVSLKLIKTNLANITLHIVGQDSKYY